MKIADINSTMPRMAFQSKRTLKSRDEILDSLENINPINRVSDMFGGLSSRIRSEIREIQESAKQGVSSRIEQAVDQKITQPLAQKTVQKLQQMMEQASSQSLDEDYDYYEEPIVRNRYRYNNRPSLVRRILQTGKDIISLPVYGFEIVKDKIQTHFAEKEQTREFAQRSLQQKLAQLTLVDVKQEIAAPILNQKLSLKKMKLLEPQINELLELQKVLEDKQNELELLRKEYYANFVRYMKSININHLKPDFKEFIEYQSLDFDSLTNLLERLKLRISYQEGINSLKGKYHLGIEKYLSQSELEMLRYSSLESIEPDKYSIQGKKFIHELKRLSISFLENSNRVANYLILFKNFIDSFKNNVKSGAEEIYETNRAGKNIYKNVPNIADMPEEMKAQNKINLFYGFINDFGNVGSIFSNGLKNVLSEYNHYFKSIKKFMNSRKLTQEEELYAKTLLEMLSKAREEKISVYVSLLDDFGKLGKIICALGSYDLISSDHSIPAKSVRALSKLK